MIYELGEEMPSKKILLVDDNIELASILADYLRAPRIEIIVLHHGNQVLSALRSNRIDLCLLDVMLPGCSGLDLLKCIRYDTSMPVILMSAHRCFDEPGMHLGATAFFIKPLSLRRLSMTTAALLAASE